MHETQLETFAGIKQFEVKDETNNISFPVLVQYPTHQKPLLTNFGPYTMDVCVDAKIIDELFPLVIISHGNSGSNLLYRTISTFLAKNGYIVAMLEHYGNNRHNNELEKSIKNLEYRPRHVSLTIDYLLSDSIFGQNILIEKIAMVGHSFGGYTALALAGGQPWTKSGEQIEVQKDQRIKALILMAPAAAFFIPKNSLAEVNIPILLLIAERDEYTPKEHTAGVVINGVPDKSKVTLKVINNAGHFSFISPFPPTKQNPNFLPSTDPEGFDREEFHKQLPKDILNFLNHHLYSSLIK